MDSRIYLRFHYAVTQVRGTRQTSDIKCIQKIASAGGLAAQTMNLTRQCAEAPGPPRFAFSARIRISMRPRLAAWISSALLLVSGCGYHSVNSAVHLPSTVHTLAIPSFRNATQSYHTEATFTEAVIREFNSRTSYRIVPGTDPGADATLEGTITNYAVSPLTYDNISGQTSSYLITITARLALTDRRGKVLWQNPSYVFREQYEQTQDLASFIQEDSAATRRLAQEFARAAVADIMESF